MYYQEKVIDEVVDKFGNKKCAKCSSVYGKACQVCCGHEIELYDDYHDGLQIECLKCSKEFSLDEFELQFDIVPKVGLTLREAVNVNLE